MRHIVLQTGNPLIAIITVHLLWSVVSSMFMGRVKDTDAYKQMQMQIYRYTDEESQQKENRESVTLI